MMNRQNKYPLHGWLGLLLTAIFWFLNWYLEGLRTHLAFFPLLLGYILAVVGLFFLRKGTLITGKKPSQKQEEKMQPKTCFADEQIAIF